MRCELFKLFIGFGSPSVSTRIQKSLKLDMPAAVTYA